MTSLLDTLPAAGVLTSAQTMQLVVFTAAVLVTFWIVASTLADGIAGLIHFAYDALERRREAKRYAEYETSCEAWFVEAGKPKAERASWFVDLVPDPDGVLR